ncbi:MAG: 50S ribosomal protein L32 [bacterium]
MELGVPKKKKTKTKILSRQSHLKIDPPQMVECPHCHELMEAHRVCPHCGYYDGEQKVEIVVKEHKKKMRGR